MPNTSNYNASAPTDASIHIPSELMLPAQSAHFCGEVDIPLISYGPDLYTFALPIAWEVDVTNTGEALLVEGTCEGVGTTACARCAQDAHVSLLGEVEGYFFIDASDIREEDKQDDDFACLPENHTIDLLPLIQASLLLDMPAIPLCSNTCKGLCSTCGANLNDGPCSCSTEHDVHANSPFAVLRNFTLE